MWPYSGSSLNNVQILNFYQNYEALTTCQNGCFIKYSAVFVLDLAAFYTLKYGSMCWDSTQLYVILCCLKKKKKKQYMFV